ncbi:MAG: FecR family protein, partial [Opitutaceae bacterium]
ARDAARPFVVEASGLAVRAVGTAFTVSTRAGAVEVLVTEGKVRLEPSRATMGTPAPAPIVLATPALLAAGEKAVVPLRGETARPEFTRVSPVEIDAAMAWHQGLLSFDATPLGEIVEAFNGYNRHQLVVADSALARRNFGGSFRADDPEGFLALLRATSDIAIEHREAETIIRRAR